MRKTLITILCTLFILGLLYVGLNIFRSYPPTDEQVTSSSTSSISVNFSAPTQAPINPEPPAISQLKQAGWIADFAINSGIESFAANPKAFYSISPVWYTFDENDNFRAKRTGYDRISQIARDNGVKLIPAISTFEADPLHEILKDKDKLDAHIQFLINEVETYNFDGLDLDYESIYYEDQPAFLYLQSRLYEYLNDKGKMLTIAIMPIWTNADILDSLRQTRAVQDYSEIAQYAHEVRIMTYNVTNYTSAFPGPVAPLDWMEATLRYAVTQIDRDKIVLGINHYGYDGWSNNLVIPEKYLGVTANPSLDKGQADAVTYRQVQEYSQYKVSDIMDPSSQEKLFKYRFEDKDYAIFYPDVESTKLRVDLAKQWGIAGLAYWRMGNEDRRIYELVQ